MNYQNGCDTINEYNLESKHEPLYLELTEECPQMTTCYMQVFKNIKFSGHYKILNMPS